MTTPIEAFYAVSAIGIAYSLISIIITKRFGNRERVKEIQKEVNEINKRYTDALKRGDKAEVARTQAEQARLPGLLKDSMILQFKPLVLLLPFLLVLPAVARMLFPDFVITLSFDIPIFIQNWERFPNWRSEFGAVGWFWLSFLFSSLSAQLLIGVKDKLGGRKADKAGAPTGK